MSSKSEDSQIERLEKRVQQLEDQVGQVPEVADYSRRDILTGVAILGTGAAVGGVSTYGAVGRASAASQGTIGTSTNPLSNVHTDQISSLTSISTDEVDGGVTSTPIQDFEGSNLSVDGSNVLNAATNAIWTEESGSPYTATGTDSASSINPSSLDTFDTYLIYVKATDQATSSTDTDMQVGGDTGANYIEWESTTRNTGQSEWGPVIKIGSDSTSTAWLHLANQQDIVALSVWTTGGNTDHVWRGENQNVSWAPSQFTLTRGVDTDWEVRIWGRDI